jgi:hypothetical protein
MTLAVLGRVGSLNSRQGSLTDQTGERRSGETY